MPPLESALLAIAIVAFASAVQASIGFGLALVAAPLLALIDRDYVPGPMLVAGLALSVIMSWRERHAIDFSGLKAATLGRVIATPLAALLLAFASAASFDLLFSALVLAAVGLSLLHPHVRPTSGAVFSAGLASGFMGTITSIGGPPLALVYQNAKGPELRATLAGLFVVGSLISIASLAAVGLFGSAELGRAAVLVVGVPLGVWASRPLLARFDESATRPLVLALSAGAALLVLARVLF